MELIQSVQHLINIIKEKLAGKADANHTHSYAGSSSVGGAATSAVKLNTARTIGISEGVTGTATSFNGAANISIPVTAVKESYLAWGGKNFSGSYGPIDAAMINDLGANRLMFGKAAGITVEYSRDGGATWTDYGLTDSQKVALFSTGCSCGIGKNDSNNKATNQYLLRVTIDSDSFGIYTALNKFVVYLSTSGSSDCYCTITASLESTPATWVTFADRVPVSGWSGFNVINTSILTTYGNSNSKGSQYGLIRFTFGCGSQNTTYNGMTINKIMGFGGVGWSTPSNMAARGHLYSFDSSQNATFPAGVTASSFTENGTSLANKYATKNHSHSEYLSSDPSSSGYVPATRTINSKALSSNITLTASDVGALAANGKAASATVADSANAVAWDKVTGKPTSFTPASHGNHVPTVQTASNKVFLRNDNTWQTITPANIGAAASSHGTHVPGIKSATAVTTLGWGTNNTYVPDISQLAYWNGAYSGTSSNLAYCNKGAFGDMATKSSSSYLTTSGTAAKATADASGNTITSSYGASLAVSSTPKQYNYTRITLKAKNGAVLTNIDFYNYAPSCSCGA